MRARQTVAAALLLLGWVGPAAASELADAVKQRDHEAVRVLIAKGADVDASEPDGTKALHWAVQAGDLISIDLLIRAHATVNAVNQYGVTPLGLAATRGYAGVVQSLLKARADVDQVSADGQTALMSAARSGSVETVKLLLAHGANANARERWFGQTALMWAAAQNHTSVVIALLEAGADANARTISLERFTTPPSGVQTSPRGGLTPLLYAARQGALASARALADGGASLDLADPDGINPLMMALLNAHYDVAALLIEKGANLNLADRNGRAPLFVAVDMHTLESRFNRPAPRPSGALDSVDLVKLLVARGANVDAKLTGNVLPPKTNAPGNPNLVAGSTPFLKAATTSDTALMRLLLDAGADPHAVNRVGTNALMMAAGLNWRVLGSIGTQHDAIEAIQLLLDRGLEINATNEQGQTALHGAVMRSDASTELIRFLVGKGADMSVKNKVGQTPLDLARGVGDPAAPAANQRTNPNPVAADLLAQLMEQATAKDAPISR